MIRFIFFFFILVLIVGASCNTEESPYEKVQIFPVDPTAEILKEGQTVHFHYWMLKDTQLLMSSEMSGGPTVLKVNNVAQLNHFERPLLWLRTADSCIVEIHASNARAELQSWSTSFGPNDKATFIYKVLKIES